mmetsp:Transcript_1014/g.1668  ORF Transcript_1014/g.1668 Transcript_1014/m.1668 type:complete len:207 (+) Transcript_1014:685-1305(+)
MDACKNGYFSKQDSIKGQTASQTADNVATTIVESGRPDPRKNEQGHTFLMIKRQKKSYSKSDSPVKHQKALPPEVYRTILRSSNHPRELARAQTLGAALFFCMRSCEYSLTPRNEEQKTRPIRPCDITFRLNGTVLPHDHPSLHLSNTVSITTFIFLGQCNSKCPRTAAHTSPAGNKARMDTLRKFIQDCLLAYKENKKPSDPDFH